MATYSSLEVAPDRQAPIVTADAIGYQHQPVHDGQGHDSSQYGDSSYYASDKRAAMASYAEEEPVGKRRGICGMATRTFWIIVLVVILVGAAVGGGVGGYQAGKQSSLKAAPQPMSSGSSPSDSSGDSASTATAGLVTASKTSTVYVSTATTSPFICPAQDKSYYETSISGVKTTWRRYCYVNSSGNDIRNSNNLDYFLQMNDCINACAAYGPRCVGVVKSGNPNATTPGPCWFKNALVTPYTVGDQNDQTGSFVGVRCVDGVC